MSRSQLKDAARTLRRRLDEITATSEGEKYFGVHDPSIVSNVSWFINFSHTIASKMHKLVQVEFHRKIQCYFREISIFPPLAFSFPFIYFGFDYSNVFHHVIYIGIGVAGPSSHLEKLWWENVINKQDDQNERLTAYETNCWNFSGAIAWIFIEGKLLFVMIFRSSKGNTISLLHSKTESVFTGEIRVFDSVSSKSRSQSKLMTFKYLAYVITDHRN